MTTAMKTLHVNAATNLHRCACAACVLQSIHSMLMGDNCSLLCLHGASLTDRLVGGVWHARSLRVYLTSGSPAGWPRHIRAGAQAVRA